MTMLENIVTMDESHETMVCHHTPETEKPTFAMGQIGAAKPL
jgi:hypothetical protein